LSIYMHVYTIFPPYNPPTLFPYILPPPTDTNSPDRTCSALCSLICKRKKWHCLFKIALQGVSMRHFHVYMYYNWIGSSSSDLAFQFLNRLNILVIQVFEMEDIEFICRTMGAKQVSHFDQFVVSVEVRVTPVKAWKTSLNCSCS
jgi:hypothetical protein